jgi:pimeloyl-ACP methyl ester carboxylesterase
LNRAFPICFFCDISHFSLLPPLSVGVQYHISAPQFIQSFPLSLSGTCPQYFPEYLSVIIKLIIIFVFKITKQCNMNQSIITFALVLFAIPCFSQVSYKYDKNVPYVEDAASSSYTKEACVSDIYYPVNKPNFKTLIWIHGGALVGGKQEIPWHFKNAGIAVVGVNYRLSPKVNNPEYIKDVAKAVAWTFRHIKAYGGDPSQIYVAGHSAGGYLTLMLALDKSYLAAEGIDADSVKCYFPVSGQTATHYTIRKERNLPMEIPIVDKSAPLNNARKLGTKMIIITADRRLEQMARYEENAYLKAVLEGIGNQPIPLYELAGFNHGTVVDPACDLILNSILGRK